MAKTKTTKSKMCPYRMKMMMVAVALSVAVILGTYFTFAKENYETKTISSCPASIMYENKTYTHLAGHDTVLEANQGYGSCDFDITSCIYGRNIQDKTMNDGKKVARVWWNSPACGRTNWKKTFKFCDKDDIVAVHFKDIADSKKRKIVYAGKTGCVTDCNNSCLAKYGMSANKSVLDNASINPGIDGFENNKECNLKYNTSNVKII